MPRRSDKNLPLWVRSLLKSGMRMLTPSRDEAFVEDTVEEHTPRTPSTERPGTPPPPNYACEMEHATPPESYTTPEQTEEVQTGIPEKVGTEGPEIPPQVGVQSRLSADLGVEGVNQSKATQHIEVPERSIVNTKADKR
jgi:hypothetical protein